MVCECPSCGVVGPFHECERESSLNLYVVLDLFSETKTVFRCTHCGDVFELDEEAYAAERAEESTFDVAHLERARPLLVLHVLRRNPALASLQAG